MKYVGRTLELPYFHFACRSNTTQVAIYTQFHQFDRKREFPAHVSHHSTAVMSCTALQSPNSHVKSFFFQPNSMQCKCSENLQRKRLKVGNERAQEYEFRDAEKSHLKGVKFDRSACLLKSKMLNGSSLQVHAT